LKLEPLLRVKAKERMLAGKKPDPTQKSAEGETRKDLAKAAGVSHDTIAKGKVIEAKASEETKAALRSGETSINAEYKRQGAPQMPVAAFCEVGRVDCIPLLDEKQRRRRPPSAPPSYLPPSEHHASN